MKQSPMAVAAKKTGSASTVWTEQERLQTLRGYGSNRDGVDADLEEIARFATESFKAPVSAIILFEYDRQVFKAAFGVSARPTAVKSDHVSALLAGDIVIPDVSNDSRFDFTPILSKEPGLRSYAGVVLRAPDGMPIGTLCVFDHQARDFTEAQLELLGFLANQTMRLLERQRANEGLENELAEVRQSRLLMRKFEQLITQAPGFIAIVDTQGYVSYLNGFARNVVGLKPDESIPPGVEFFMAPDERGTFHDDLMPLIRSGERRWQHCRLRLA